MRCWIRKGRRLRVLDEEGRVDRLRQPRWVVWGMGSGVGNGEIVESRVSVGLLQGVSLHIATC